MNTNFERYKSQLRCEAFLDCTDDLSKWNQKKRDFESFVLSNSRSIIYSNDLRFDSVDLYSKGIHTLFNCIYALSMVQRSYSWISVQLYYATHYFLRASLASKGIGLIRNVAMFSLKDSVNSMPVKKNSKDYQTTHGAAIRYYIDNFNTSDILLSNTIDGLETYNWLKEIREMFNYRIAKFEEPDISQYWDYIHNRIEQNDLDGLIKDYHDDNFILCFQEDHAVLALPIKRALLTKKDLEDQSIDLDFLADQTSYYQAFLGSSNTQSLLNKLII